MFFYIQVPLDCHYMYVTMYYYTDHFADVHHLNQISPNISAGITFVCICNGSHVACMFIGLFAGYREDL